MLKTYLRLAFLTLGATIFHHELSRRNSSPYKLNKTVKDILKQVKPWEGGSTDVLDALHKAEQIHQETTDLYGLDTNSKLFYTNLQQIESKQITRDIRHVFDHIQIDHTNSPIPYLVIRAYLNYKLFNDVDQSIHDLNTAINSDIDNTILDILMIQFQRAKQMIEIKSNYRTVVSQIKTNISNRNWKKAIQLINGAIARAELVYDRSNPSSISITDMDHLVGQLRAIKAAIPIIQKQRLKGQWLDAIFESINTQTGESITPIAQQLHSAPLPNKPVVYRRGSSERLSKQIKQHIESRVDRRYSSPSLSNALNQQIGQIIRLKTEILNQQVDGTVDNMDWIDNFELSDQIPAIQMISAIYERQVKLSRITTLIDNNQLLTNLTSHINNKDIVKAAIELDRIIDDLTVYGKRDDLLLLTKSLKTELRKKNIDHSQSRVSSLFSRYSDSDSEHYSKISHKLLY